MRELKKTFAFLIITMFMFSSFSISLSQLKAQSEQIPIVWQYDVGEDNFVWQVDISDDGRCMVAGTWRVIFFFEKSGSTPVWTYSSEATHIGISGDGRYFAARKGGTGLTPVYLFESSSNSPLWSYPGHSVAISRDGKYVSTSKYNGEYTVSLFSRSVNQPIWTAHLTGGDIDFTALSSNGEYLVAVDDSGRVYLFHRSSSTPIWIFKAEDKMKNVAISRDGNYIAAGCEDHNVYFFSRESSTPLWNYTTKGFFYANRFGIAMSNDGSYIAVGSGYGGYGPQPGDKNVYLFHKTSSTPLWKYETSAEAISVSISGDGQRLIAGNVGGQVYFFDTASGIPIWSFDTGDVAAAVVAISNDGNYAIAGTHRGGGKIFLFGPLSAPIDSLDSLTAPFWKQWWFWTTIALGITTSVFAFTTTHYRKKWRTLKESKVTPAKPVSKKEYIVCPNCGAKLPMNSTFCGKCGTPLK